ncbi:hypothetical protein ISN45_At03g044280 [Arabidopsis thaliana x Arabidopsis arenosa]|uniref:Uncharacterized protein n=2 Tax=Arabidopsis TaxID=3701 RepID=A0A8T2FIR2_ARASU|nr:hypothetical protein ISN45_At03g044280 [Arabidopsis thaliana x Arabidopsis arenosa]KAG7634053.1 hypothetical protein ISN44_As03g043210 [Arabidopsis suecica]
MSIISPLYTYAIFTQQTVGYMGGAFKRRSLDPSTHPVRSFSSGLAL